MQNRPTAFTSMGGDTVQMLKTKQYLEKLGVSVDISLDIKPSLKGYDIVHIFNIQDCVAYNSYLQIVNAKKNGTPVVLSPIYWEWDNLEVNKYKIDFELMSYHKKSDINIANFSFIKSINDFLEKAIGIRIKTASSLQLLADEIKIKKENEFLKLCQISSLLLIDCLLPNAKQELDLITKKFGINFRKISIVPNAVDKSLKYTKSEGVASKLVIKDYVLCIGRIEPIKNQLNLIKAMNGLDIPVLLIGRKNASYFDKCRRIADKNIYFLDEIPHEQVYSYYLEAKVHALPSWRETPGLVNLEAGLAGCNLVVSNRGTTEEYFKDFAYYCNPADIDSIRNSILQAYRDPRNNKLSEYIENNFTWECAAETTFRGYKNVLGEAQ